MPLEQHQQFTATLSSQGLTATLTPQRMRATFAEGVPGPPGPPGEPGEPSTILAPVGSEGELPPEGERGELVLTEDTGDLWSWNTPAETGAPVPAGHTADEYMWLNVGHVVGPPGAQGPVGPAGPQGIQGPAGPQGPAGVGIDIQGSVPTYDDLPDGTGAGVKPGDAYITEDTGDLWVWQSTGPTDPGHWVNAGHVVGPPGPAGPQGPTGPQGPQGDPATNAITTVFGRTGAVVATSGDYTAAQVTNAVSVTGSYADPAWITSLDWTKISNKPTIPNQTPWTSHIDGAGFELRNAGRVGIGTASPASKLSLGQAAPNITQRIALFEDTASGNAFRGIGMANPSAGVYGVGVYANVTPTDTNMALFVRDGGNVGIGTSAPGARLHSDVGAAGQGTMAAFIYGSVTAGDFTAPLGVTRKKATLTIGTHYGVGSDSCLVNCYSIDGDGRFWVGANGNVGIGTSTPGAPLHAVGGDNTNVVRISPASNLGKFIFFTPESSANRAALGYWAATGYGMLELNGVVAMPSLPASNPGAGSRQLWYDPADANRVKFAA